MTTRRLALIAAFAIAVAGRANAEEKLTSISTPDALGYFMTYYYQEPRPDLVPAAIAYLEHGSYPHNDNEGEPLIGFFSEVFAGNPTMRNRWKAAADQTTGPTKRMLDAAFEIAKNPSVLTTFDPLRADPSQNDRVWGAFFASGKPVYVNALIDRLAYLSERKSLMLFMTAGSAQWSLASNARQHPAVKRLLEQAKVKAKPAIRASIDEALTKDPGAIRDAIASVIRTQHDAKAW